MKNKMRLICENRQKARKKKKTVPSNSKMAATDQFSSNSEYFFTFVTSREEILILAGSHRNLRSNPISDPLPPTSTGNSITRISIGPAVTEKRNNHMEGGTLIIAAIEEASDSLIESHCISFGHGCIFSSY